jgi:hypothetical protein
MEVLVHHLSNKCTQKYVRHRHIKSMRLNSAEFFSREPPSMPCPPSSRPLVGGPSDPWGRSSIVATRCDRGALADLYILSPTRWETTASVVRVLELYFLYVHTPYRQPLTSATAGVRRFVHSFSICWTVESVVGAANWLFYCR